MNQRPQEPIPDRPVAVALVEGGDERVLCRALCPNLPIVYWVAHGREFEPLVRLLMNEPNYTSVTAVGIVLDAEDDPSASLALAQAAATHLIGSGVGHAEIREGTSCRVGAFVLPDGRAPGSVETLCKSSLQSRGLARCVDDLMACAAGTGSAHSTVARGDKRWLQAYLAATGASDTRFHDAFRQSLIDPSNAVFDPLRRFLEELAR